MGFVIHVDSRFYEFFEFSNFLNYSNCLQNLYNLTLVSTNTCSIVPFLNCIQFSHNLLQFDTGINEHVFGYGIMYNRIFVR